MTERKLVVTCKSGVHVIKFFNFCQTSLLIPNTPFQTRCNVSLLKVYGKPIAAVSVVGYIFVLPSQDKTVSATVTVVEIWMPISCCRM